MVINREIQIIIDREDIERLLRGESIQHEGFVINPGWNLDNYMLKELNFCKCYYERRPCNCGE